MRTPFDRFVAWAATRLGYVRQERLWDVQAMLRTRDCDLESAVRTIRRQQGELDRYRRPPIGVDRLFSVHARKEHDLVRQITHRRIEIRPKLAAIAIPDYALALEEYRQFPETFARKWAAEWANQIAPDITEALKVAAS